MPGFWKLTVGGFVSGVAGVLVFHQGLTTVLYHQFELLQHLLWLPDALRPTAPGYNLGLQPPFGLPNLLQVCLFGGFWGVLLLSTLRATRLPELITGLVLGTVVCTFVGFQFEVGVRGMPFWSGGYLPVWISIAMVNGAWGWGTAGILRGAGLLGERR